MTGTLGRGAGKTDMFAEMESKLMRRRALAEGQPGDEGGGEAVFTAANAARRNTVAANGPTNLLASSNKQNVGVDSPRTNRKLVKTCLCTYMSVKNSV